MTAICAFRNVSRRALSPGGRRRALRDVSLDVRTGELLVLLGPADAGKTTLVSLLAGFAEPDAGEVLLHGQDAAHVPPHRRNLGVISFSDDLFPHLSVAANVAFPLRARGFGRRERDDRTARALEMFGLHETVSGLLPAHIAPVLRQRAALARAIVFGPELLLLDEPFAGFGPEARADLQADLRHLHRALGITILHATRDKEEALALADRIAVLHSGSLLQVADPATLYERPATPAVARLLGNGNELHGTVEAAVAAAAAEEDVPVRLDGGAIVAATPAVAGRLLAGERCLVFVRPERLAVAAADLGDGAVPARVLDSGFRGDHLRVVLDVGGGDRLLVRRPAALGKGGLEPGAQVSVAWPAQHALAFPASS